jgi:branched-chain amino acid transport system substrate-binding protein
MSPLDNSSIFLIPPVALGPVIVEGSDSTVRDDASKSYIDLESGPGVSSVGHCHPRIVTAIREQAGKLIHSPGRYVSHLGVSLAERIASLTNGRLTRTFFANSGAEANDGAVKLSLKHALGRAKRGFGIIALERGFHGRLSLPLSLTGMAEQEGLWSVRELSGRGPCPRPLLLPLRPARMRSPLRACWPRSPACTIVWFALRRRWSSPTRRSTSCSIDGGRPQIGCPAGQLTWRSVMNSLDLVSIIGILGALLLGSGQALAQEELKIGAVGSLSGGGTDWGVATQRGMELAVAEVKTQGGLHVGSKSYVPRVIMYDDQYTGQGGTTAAQRLVNVDNVGFIVGPIGSPAVLGVLNVTRPKNVIVLSDGFSPKILAADSTHNFRVSLTTLEFAPAIVRWLREHQPGAKRVAVISPNDAVGQQVVPILVNAYKANNFEVAFDEKYERGMNDFTPILTRILAGGVDVLELDSNAPGETGLLLRQARQLGLKGTIIQTGGPAVEETVKVAGPLAEDFLSYEIFDPADPRGASFIKAYREKYQGPLNPYAPIMYNATQILFEAMRRAGSLEVKAVRAGIEKLSGYDTIFGPVRWGGKNDYGIDHQLLTDFLLVRVKNGKVETVSRVSP